MIQRFRWLSDGVLLSIAAIWGMTFVLVQDAIATLPPFSFLAIRFSVAVLLLLPFLRSQPHTSNTSAEYRSARMWIGGIVIGSFLFMGYALQTFSLLYTTSGKSGFLTGLSVTLVPLLSWLVLRSRPTRTALIGVGCATVGLYLLAFVDIRSINPGDILAFLCAIGFGLQIVYTGKFSTGTSASQIAILQLATVAILSTIAALFFEPWQHIIQSGMMLQPNIIIALVVTAVFATAIAYLAQTHIQKYTTPTRVALIFASEPVFAALADYLWHGIALGPRALIGCLLILGGTLLTELPLAKLTLRQHNKDSR
ncbi:membrane protein [Dictyobacter alpinus]|uniref:Membrane protein n=1 Tax=Dictyobacter alpinus TaxID=2014873 RepID=A0A402BB11_9CHLR|nr:DMT family transporter [Dictyobacter alpinus]GCE28496.1 membrane protein [Dictyobacter alpinus]